MIEERPILYSSPMICAILEDRKTMTRRVVKWKPIHEGLNLSATSLSLGYYCTGAPLSGHVLHSRDGRGVWNDRTHPAHCPYGRVGERLWVRESFYAYGKYRFTGERTETGKPEVEFWDCTLDANGSYRYAADETLPKPSSRYEFGWHKRPSIFMPRIASRVTLEIKNIRVERLQDISQEDMAAEGFRAYVDEASPRLHEIAREDFGKGWDGINGKRKGCSWQNNPFVWVIEFRKVAANDAPLPMVTQPHADAASIR
jgi:hypothetical protein